MVIDMEIVKDDANKDNYDPLREKRNHCHEVAVNFPKIKKGLNMHFKGVCLITERIIP